MQPPLQASHAGTRSLQDALDAASLELRHWTAVLPFVIRNTSSFSSGAVECVISETQCDNLLEYLKPMYKGCKIYFSAKYNYQQAMCSGGHKGWKELLNDIEDAGMQGGFYPVSNGGNHSKRVIICRSSRMYQGTKQDQHSPRKQGYRQETLHSDRNNSRGCTGKRLPRKTQTTRALDKASACPFRFNIRADEIGFFLVGGTGCAHHAHHPKLSNNEYAVPTRLIGVAERDILVSVGEAKANDGVGRNVHYSRCGYVIPRSQVRYINGFRTSSENTDHGNHTRQLEFGVSAADKLLKSLKNKGYDHCILYHHVRGLEPVDHRLGIGEEPLGIDNGTGGSEVMINESYGAEANCSASPPSTLTIVTLPESEIDDMHSFAKAHRNSLSVHDKQDLMIGCAWTTPPEKRMFKMLSDVLHIDCTADTNHEDRPFLTITGRDSNGKMFTILRAFLPNERAWVFRWLFQMVMPTLLGKEYIARVKVIVTDGDSQETSQLDIAIALHYRDVCRVRCGWHVVDRGWNRVCPGVRSVSRGNEKAFKAICIEIKNWLYSWMQASCETEAEYKISKALLAAYLCHSTFVNIATEPGADRIRTFIREHVEPLESFFCFYPRRNVRHFDTYTNSAHEGTNNGLKTSAVPVLPQHSLDTSASILNHNAQIKATSTSIRTATAVSSQILWSKLSTSQKLTRKGEGLVIEQWKLRSNYVSQRVGEKLWLVAWSNQEKKRASGIIPRFSRVREVSIVDGDYLLCSCMHFERIGIPCRHQMYVLSSISREYEGITHHDVSVTWWKEFIKYAFSDDPSCQKVAILYQKLLFNDTRGPSVPKGIELPPIMSTILDQSLVMKPTNESCLNYDVATINSALMHLRQPLSSSFDSVQLGNDHARLMGKDDDDDDDDDDGDFGPCNTQQETHTYGRNNCELVFPDHDTPDTRKENSPYSVLVPLAKELASILEGNCTVEELQEYKSFLSNSIAKKKSEMMNARPWTADVQMAGKMVSSSVRSNKKQKTHGTKHMGFHC